MLDTSQLKKNAKESGVYGTENSFEIVFFGNTKIVNYRNADPDTMEASMKGNKESVRTVFDTLKDYILE